MKDLIGVLVDVIIVGIFLVDGVVINIGVVSGFIEINLVGIKFVMLVIFDIVYIDLFEIVVKIIIKVDMNDIKFGKVGEIIYLIGFIFEDGFIEKIVKLGDSDIIDIIKVFKFIVVFGSKVIVKFVEKILSVSV